MAASPERPGGGEGRTGAAAVAARTVSRAFAALEQLAGGLATSVLALLVLPWLLLGVLTVPLGVGVLLTPVALSAAHALAHRERERLGRWGPEVVGPERPSTRLRLAWADPVTRRTLRWLVRHGTFGLLLGALGVLLPLFAVRDVSFPLWWRLVPEGVTSTSIGIGTARSWTDAGAAGLLGLCWCAAVLLLSPRMARLQAGAGRRLLAASPEADLSLRVAELTASRAAALDAHASELRRIERALHDGAQNRMIRVTVLLGAARRMAARDPSQAESLLEQTQTAVEDALAELRSVSRSILPPVLADRGLEAALTALAADCAVPCAVEVEAAERCAASVEATAYFVVAEALTNIAKHSGAHRAAVKVSSSGGRLHLRIEDDGHGGAEEEGGSGLSGIRRRVAAHDGSLTVGSPPGGPTALEVRLPCGV
ncbi:sensor histidine kinase [Streptomyces xiaopingdaonensis]|uniref:sensor histidine kinase n=1 Tax=Streptomyces xiaopingdaonensis TaxID=1565415 RepID=UPI0002EACB72|nr:sensor histidine kinase [Streptomyces xiaopingdaonensis]